MKFHADLHALCCHIAISYDGVRSLPGPSAGQSLDGNGCAKKVSFVEQSYETHRRQSAKLWLAKDVRRSRRQAG